LGFTIPWRINRKQMTNLRWRSLINDQLLSYFKATKPSTRDGFAISTTNFDVPIQFHQARPKKPCANRCHVLAGAGKTRKLKQPLRKSKCPESMDSAYYNFAGLCLPFFCCGSHSPTFRSVINGQKNVHLKIRSH